MPDLISWLPTLSLVLYLWICLAYLVAFLRTRQPHWLLGAVLGVVLGRLTGLAIANWLTQGTVGLLWISLGAWVCYTILIIIASRLESHHMYGTPAQVLLLRAPRPPAAEGARPWRRFDLPLLLSGTLLLCLASVGSIGQMTCNWLDVALRRSDCLGRLPYTSRTESTAFSPDGSLMVIGGSHAAEVWRMSDRRRQSTLGPPDHPASQVAFSPDGALIATSTDDEGVRLWRVSDGGLVRLLAIDGLQDAITRIKFSPDGQLVAAHAMGMGESFVWLWRVADGSLIRKVSSGGWGMAFSPDSALLLMQDDHGSIVLARVSDGVVVRTLDEPLIGQDLAFSPDGRLIAGFWPPEGIAALWSAADGKLLRTIKIPQAWLFSVAFSPDSTLLAIGTGDGEVQLWGTDDGQLRKVLKHGLSWVVSMAFSPDGRTLSTATLGSYAYLWRVPQ